MSASSAAASSIAAEVSSPAGLGRRLVRTTKLSRMTTGMSCGYTCGQGNEHAEVEGIRFVGEVGRVDDSGDGEPDPEALRRTKRADDLGQGVSNLHIFAPEIRDPDGQVQVRELRTQHQIASRKPPGRVSRMS